MAEPVLTPQDVNKKNIQKLVAAADYYADLSPVLTRFYMSEVEKMKKAADLQPTAAQRSCQFCGGIFRPNNHHFRVIPRIKVNTKMQKLLGRQRENTVLGKFQKRLLDLCTQRKNRVVIVCHGCMQRTVFNCQREPTQGIAPAKATTSNMVTARQTSGGRMSQVSCSSLTGSLDISDTSSVVNFGTPQFSSTPMLPRKLEESQKLPTSKSAPSLLSASKVSATGQSLRKNKHKKDTRNKQSHSTLQRMLAEQDKARRQGSSGSLKEFLSTV